MAKMRGWPIVINPSALSTRHACRAVGSPLGVALTGFILRSRHRSKLIFSYCFIIVSLSFRLYYMSRENFYASPCVTHILHNTIMYVHFHILPFFGH